MHGRSRELSLPACRSPLDNQILLVSPLQGLFNTPLPTPSQAGMREETLKKIEQELDRKLQRESEALAKGELVRVRWHFDTQSSSAQCTMLLLWPANRSCLTFPAPRLPSCSFCQG
jgi:hypothetical protein